MSFVYPQFLWALLLLAIPILIHLFSFRKYKRIYFSSLQFVHQVENQNKAAQKLKNLLILIARLLTLVCIIIAFAQPYFSTSSSTNKSSMSVYAIHLDNSFSMTMRGVDGQLLSEAKESAKKIIQKLPLDVKIILSSNDLSGVESRLTSKIEALERIDQISTSPMSRSFDEVVKWQKNILKQNFVSNLNNVNHIYLSDFQKITTDFKSLKSDSIARYFPIQFKAQIAANLSIDSLWFESPLHKKNVSNQFFVKVSNHSDSDLKNVQLNFQCGTINRDLFVSVPANQSAVASLSFAPQSIGYQSGSVQVADQQFYADDSYYFSFRVAKQSRILILNGEHANSNIKSIYELDDFYQVQEISINSFTQGILSGVNLLILNGVNELSTGTMSALKDFNENGGTVVVFLGKKLNHQSINSFLSQLDLPLIQQEITQNTRISSINYKDPFFNGVFSEEKANLSLPGVTKFYQTNSSNSNAIGVVNLQNGSPLLYRHNNKSQSFLYTSVLSQEYGSVLSDILFPTMILRMGELALRNTPISVVLGKTSHFPIYQELDPKLSITVANKHISFIPKKSIQGHTSYLNLSGKEVLENLKSGIYDLKYEDTVIGKMALNYNRNESEIAMWSSDEIKSKLELAGISNVNVLIVDKGIDSTELNIEKPFPYWKIFIFFALLFFIIELLILKLWKNKLNN